jgi:hypothetical protein
VADTARLKPEKTLAIAIVHSLQEPWLTITLDGQFKTWLKEIPKNVEIIHFHATDNSKRVKYLDKLNEYLRWRAGSKISRVRNLISKILLFSLRNWIPKYSKSSAIDFDSSSNVYRVHCWDMYATMRWKRLAVMKYFLTETNLDFLLITTSSSYLRPEILLKRISELDEEWIYAGPLIEDSRCTFVSGAQTILNRNTAKFIIENRRRIPVELLDDLGLGVFFSKHGILPTSLPTLNISSLNELNLFTRDELLHNHHFRLKAEQNGERQDVAIFHKLKKILETT